METSKKVAVLVPAFSFEYADVVQIGQSVHFRQSHVLHGTSTESLKGFGYAYKSTTFDDDLISLKVQQFGASRTVLSSTYRFKDCFNQSLYVDATNDVDSSLNFNFKVSIATITIQTQINLLQFLFEFPLQAKIESDFSHSGDSSLHLAADYQIGTSINQSFEVKSMFGKNLATLAIWGSCNSVTFDFQVNLIQCIFFRHLRVFLTSPTGPVSR